MEVVDGGGAGFDFGDDLVLFGEGRQADWKLDLLKIAIVVADDKFSNW